VKVFEVSDGVWYAAETAAEAAEEFRLDEGMGVEDFEWDAIELTDRDMESSEFRLDDENETTITFKERLARMIASEGEAFPCFFAREE
jgi:hypothetical protein